MATVLSIPDADIECVVADNDPLPRSQDLAQFNGDPRFRVVRPSQNLHMTDNFEFAVRQASGDWIFLLGGDDGVLPHRFEEFRRALLRCQTGVLTAPGIAYSWPSLSAQGNGVANWVEPCSRGTLTTKSSKPVARSLDRRSQGHLSAQLRLPRMPDIYCRGAVRREVIHEIIKRNGGRIFRTITPDYFISVAITRVVKEFSVFSRGLLIHGVSSESNGWHTLNDWAQWRRVKDTELSPDGRGPAYFGAGTIPNLEMLWLDCLFAPVSRGQRLSVRQQQRLSRMIAATTPKALLEPTREHLLTLWPDAEREIERWFKLGRLGSKTVADYRSLLQGRSRTTLALMRGGARWRAASPHLSSTLDFARLVERLDRGDLVFEQDFRGIVSRFRWLSGNIEGTCWRRSLRFPGQ
mgnify:CR=1 FL=1